MAVKKKVIREVQKDELGDGDYGWFVGEVTGVDVAEDVSENLAEDGVEFDDNDLEIKDKGRQGSSLYVDHEAVRDLAWECIKAWGFAKEGRAHGE